ncbi:addiction module toxin RelE [Pectobacterium versatile]|nr:addiction module toxin RelE [Pectobacterium versatile]RJL53607.1 addiction module toxin RelE [Pectobacterium versatile]RJL56314.1 addiction module toxin RelE [Pectobacterium versatile]RJL62356.1 addiction module toxin RelE [Pectobacterium versatile]
MNRAAPQVHACIYPIDFELQAGGNRRNPQELTQVSDWGE